VKILVLAIPGELPLIDSVDMPKAGHENRGGVVLFHHAFDVFELRGERKKVVICLKYL
jgi:hypothetical protein